MGSFRSLVRKVVRGGKPRWIIDFRYRDSEGRERRYRRDAAVQTATAARAEAERLYTLAVTKGTLEMRIASPLFREFVEGSFRDLYLPKYRPATRVRYQALLGQGIMAAFGDRRLEDISSLMLRSYGTGLLKRGVQPRGPTNFLRTILRAAVEAEVLEKMPAVPVLGKQGKKLPDAPGDGEVEAMLAHSTGWLHGAIALAAFAGLRLGEALALEVGDVELAGRAAAALAVGSTPRPSSVRVVEAKVGRILVRRALSEREVLPPKSGDEREVPLAPELETVLVPLMKDKLPHARVILNREGRTPRRQHVLTALKNLLRRFGLRERSFHGLRHYFCSKLVSCGASVEAVRLLAGHSDLAITQRYVHALGNDLKAAIAKLSGQ